MKPLSALAILATLSLAWPLVPARAQMGFSPSAPPITSSGINRGSSSVPMPVNPVQVQPGMGSMPAGYVGNSQVLSSEPIDPDHKLTRGDQLSFRVQEDRDDKVWPLTVTDSGEVQLPLGLRVKAVGKSTRQLSADIKSTLESVYYKPGHATVDLGLVAVATRSRGRVFVTGAVKQIGSFELPIDTPLTASQAINLAGGLVDFSSPQRTVILRKGGPPKGIPVNIKLVEDGQLDKDVVLQAGDTVKVPEAKFKISL